MKIEIKNRYSNGLNHFLLRSLVQTIIINGYILKLTN